MRKIALLGLLVLAPLVMAAAGKADLKITGVWVRATPPGAAAAAVYAVIENTSGEADRLVAVESPVAESAELHAMTQQGGMMVMNPIQGGLEVPAGGTLQFQPGGYHIMLVHPKQPIQEGEAVQVTLIFEKAGKITLPITARMTGPEGQGGMQRGMGHGGATPGAPAMQPPAAGSVPPGAGHGTGQGMGAGMGHGTSR